VNYENYPVRVVEDIIRLRRRITESGVPPKIVDHNLLIGTWNIRNFSRVHPQWSENSGSPKRNLRSLSYIAEIIRLFDVVAIQELKLDMSAIQVLLKNFLGTDWSIIVSDVSVGSKGNSERLGFLYDKRRVQPSGLAGEIVLAPTEGKDPVEQFDRTPYIVGFKAGREKFSLLTAHIRYGNSPGDRFNELASLAKHTAKELRDRAKGESEEHNLIVLGDFNIDDRKENILFQAFTSKGLAVPHSC
jgi:exonuclease III